jgi:L-malate glycosyltransferase
MTTTIKILHMDSAILWGGGQSQIATLIRESRDLPLEHHLATPIQSKLWFKSRSHIKGHFPIARNSALNPFAMLRARTYCRTHGIHIIHTHCGKSHTFAFWLKRLFYPEIKLIAHRRIPAKIRSNVFSRLKFESSAVDHFITVSDFIRGILMDGGVAENRVTTIRSSKKPFPCELSDRARARDSLLRTKSLSPGGDFFILSASRLVPDKGLFVLIEAFRHLIRKRPNSRLLIAGEGPLDRKLKTTARAMVRSGHVVFLGFRKDVVELLLGADLFAIPSLSEGLGSTIVEAMMARTAVVGSRIEGIPELVHDGENGLTVLPADPESLFKAFERLGDDPTLRAQLAEKAVNWAHVACTPKVMVESTYRIYLRIFELSSK